MNIFQISQELLDIFQEIEDNGGEITPELEDKLQCSQEDFKTKVENYTKVVKSVESDIDAIDKEIKRLTALKKSKTSAIERLEKVIIWAVETFGETTKSGGKYVDFGTSKVSVRNSEKVEVNEEYASAIEVAFMEQIREFAFSGELKHNDISDLVNIPDSAINGIVTRIQIDVPLKDFYGPEGEILKVLYSLNKDFKHTPNVSKTELKNELKDNPAAYPNLAYLKTNKTVTIK